MDFHFGLWVHHTDGLSHELKTPSTNNQQVTSEYQMTGFLCAQHSRSVYQHQKLLPSRVSVI